MKTNFLKLTLLALVLFTASCSNDDDEAVAPQPVVAETKTYSNLEATSGALEYVKFSFSENKIVTTDKWDVAFNGTTIIVNGGAKVISNNSSGLAPEPERTGVGAIVVVSGTFDSVLTIPEANAFKQDAPDVYALPTGTGNGWYSYSMTTHTISPIAGKILVVKTHDGKYAKLEILNYYKDAPATPAFADPTSGYYKFKFAYKANDNTTF